MCVLNTEVQNIYKTALNNHLLRDAPGALTTLCLWSVLMWRWSSQSIRLGSGAKYGKIPSVCSRWDAGSTFDPSSRTMWTGSILIAKYSLALGPTQNKVFWLSQLMSSSIFQVCSMLPHKWEEASMAQFIFLSGIK